MLSRKKDQNFSKKLLNTTTTAAKSPTPSSSTSKSMGEKRKATDDERYDEHSSEYLRRKHNFIRSTIRVDYQPDICKDYKETGFCGFGDSCKFIHDRSDYKQGWQIDQEYEKGIKEEADDKYLIRDDEEGNKEEEGDQDQCAVCKEAYKDPIVTKCKHYFCGDCADKECGEKCYTCQKATSGIFKVAKIDSMSKKK